MMNRKLKDDDYILTDKAAWFTVGPLAIRIWTDPNDQVTTVTMYEDGNEMEAELASCSVELGCARIVNAKNCAKKKPKTNKKISAQTRFFNAFKKKPN